MPHEGEDLRDVLREVRRRRVGKVVVAYLAVAFAGVEASRVLLPIVQAPELARRVVLGVLVLGFPVAVVLAWTYDITPKGVVRTPDTSGEIEAVESPTRAWLVLTAIGIATGVVLHLVGG